MTDQTQAYIPEQCYKQIQADTVQQARQQHLKRPPYLPATQAKHTHTGTHVHCWRVQQSEMGPGKSPSNSPSHFQ